MRILVAVAIVFLASSVRAQERDVDPRMLRVEDWLKAILHHQPGEFDEAAERMARWSYAELQALSIDAVALSQLMRDIRLNYFTVRRPRAAGPAADQVHAPPIRSIAPVGVRSRRHREGTGLRGAEGTVPPGRGAPPAI